MTTTSDAATPVTTIFPLSTLPACASLCGVLYDVNGKCATTTAAATVLGDCFCSDTRLTAWSSTATDLCNGQCGAADLTSIEGWYTSYCANNAALATATGTSSSSSSTSTSFSSGSSGGGSWLSSHYQWVIFLVIVVVAITGIWIGSCIWRKHYLAKKDRQYALGKNLARATESGRVVPTNPSGNSVHVPGPGMFMPAPIAAAGVYGPNAEKQQKPKEKKKWVVKERT